MVQQEEGHTSSGFQGLAQGEGWEDLKLTGEEAAEDLRDISERGGSLEAGSRAK